MAIVHRTKVYKIFKQKRNPHLSDQIPKHPKWRKHLKQEEKNV